jgi:eukaryotic-like serine/threonine-protein kinase
MSLAAGSRIGPYEVAAQIGAGGMGEVYRATDTKLKRQVAIKVLPEALAGDPERLARFQREAEVLASLNHHNIALLHGLEETDGVKALVMELVDGPTLADRIAQGPMPVEEALAIAKQIAAALEAAHEQGITHRDLKPANVKIRPDGTAKVLDFGLAKLAEPVAGSNVTATMSPTLSLNATMAGVILGTAAYMAPEQARGKAVDKRADIWAFGAVLFEMLTASQPFPGEDVSHVLARVIDRDPDWSLLPTALPSSVRTCLQRCLVKDPRQRIRDIGDARLALEGAFESPTPPVRERDSNVDAVPAPLWRRLLPTVAFSLLLSGVVGAAVWLLMRPDPRAVTKFVLTTPPDGAIDVASRVNLAIASDGTVAYAGTRNIYVRRMGTVDPVLIGDSEREVLSSPFFSPDGTSVGYLQLRPPFPLKRVPSVGGPTTTVAQFAAAPFGVSWGPDNRIVVGSPKGLVRVNASGGAVAPLTTVSSEKESHRWPYVLPNGRGVLFTVWSGSVDASRIAVVSLETGSVTPLVSAGTSPVYSPTGHLVYATNNGLRAVSFDADRLTVSAGQEVTVLENVLVNQTSGAAYYGVAANGTLVYYASPPVTDRVTLALVDVAGRAQPIGVPGPGHDQPRVSRDGRWVAYQTEFSEGTDIAVFEIGSKTAPVRLTFGGRSRSPVWSHDGRRVIFQSDRDGDRAVFWQMSDGSAPAERLTMPGKDEGHIPDSVSSDGNWLTFTVAKGEVSEVWRLSLKTWKAEPLIVVPKARVAQSVLSPDGQWIAYQSTVMSDTDIFVEPFPPTGAKYQVPSADGNHHPIWAPDSGALYYVPGARLFGHLPFMTTPRVRFGALEALALNRTARTGGPNQLRRLDVLPDGSHFIGVWPEDLANQSPDVERRIIVIENWSEELKRLMSR